MMDRYQDDTGRRLEGMNVDNPMDSDIREEHRRSERLSHRAGRASSDMVEKAKENPGQIAGALLLAGAGWLLWRSLSGPSGSRSGRRRGRMGRAQRMNQGRAYTERGQRDTYDRGYRGDDSRYSDRYDDRYGGRVRAYRQDDDFDHYGGYGYGRDYDQYDTRDYGRSYGLGNYGQRNYGYRYGYGDRYGYGQQDYGDTGYGELGSSAYGTYGLGSYGATDLGRSYGTDAYDLDDYDANYYGSSDYGSSYQAGNYGLGSDYGRGADDYNWSYSEVWLIPGPHSGRGPAGYQRSAERIKEDIEERLTQHGGLDASGIQVKVEGSEVTLEGTVDDRRSKRLAEDAAEDVFGITEVHNHLRVQSQGGQRQEQT